MKLGYILFPQDKRIYQFLNDSATNLVKTARLLYGSGGEVH
jgi:hypothetical protein